MGVILDNVGNRLARMEERQAIIISKLDRLLVLFLDKADFRKYQKEIKEALTEGYKPSDKEESE